MADILAFSKPPELGGICETETAQKVHGALRVCQKLRLCGAIIGPPGTGKTYTVRHFIENEPAAWLCTANEIRATAFAALQMIAEEVGSYYVERGERACFSGIVHSIRARSNGILIIVSLAQPAAP